MDYPLQNTHLATSNGLFYRYRRLGHSYLPGRSAI